MKKYLTRMRRKALKRRVLRTRFPTRFFTRMRRKAIKKLVLRTRFFKA